MLVMRKEGSKVLLTNSQSAKKRGPKQVESGSLYTFAHQAYWGFRFLAGKRATLWKRVLLARTVAQVTEVGKICSRPRIMTGAGYGAAGLMTWLADEKAAMQVLAAKKHRRYPSSRRPSTEDRKMIFLGISVAAGVFGIEFSTALRKLAQAGLGPHHMVREVHRFDQFLEHMKRNAFVWAEPVENFFFPLANGKWDQMRDLPCKVPGNFRGGFIIYGFGPNGETSTFSRTLPLELQG